MATALETGLDWGTRIDASVITYRFAAAGEVHAGLTAYDWFPYEIAQVKRAIDLFETFLNVTFAEAASGQHLTLVVTSGGGMGGALGFFYPPGEAHGGLGAFNWQGVGWDYATPGTGALEQGGFGFVTIIHEFGHALGLAHPHDEGGSSSVFPGVSSAFGDYGDFDLNQGLSTMMSYNSGWEMNPDGVPAGIAAYGYEGTPMAIDIAVLQAKYGANLAYRTGNDTYVLPDANAVGTFYGCIWDAGGIDTIVHNGNAAAAIDLRAATLRVEEGGGGFLSRVDQVHGGFTIANGVVIENATGGGGADIIRGNAAANALSGRGGDDLVEGFGGADLLDGGAGADAMRGGKGNDTYVVDHGRDIVDESTGGSGGVDLVRSSVAFSLADAGRGLGKVENLILTGSDSIAGAGNGLDNLVKGNAGDNLLSGGGGRDTLCGGAGRDSLAGGRGADFFLFDTAPGRSNADRIADFRPGQDRILLDREIFGDLRPGVLKKSAFPSSKAARPADAGDRIIYDPNSGKLRFDEDGKGGLKARLFAVLDNHPDRLGHDDFLVVA